MAESSSSPTSSCSSMHSSPFSQPEFASLPVMSMRKKIVDKILENRVTLIVGETGCGKSSQVPQFLLEENIEPILCTQPRRFAVVAVAKMVAKARKCELGGEVGYHIGHSKLLSERSKIVFKTAGVLIEEMREKGLNALKYKVIILDEVHERSVESDLVLVCVKQFLLRNSDLRVVLMSATADFGRYRDYFRDLGRGERVEVLAIPSSNQQALFQRRVSYLEQITEFLGINLESPATRYCSGPSPVVASADIKPEVHKLIHDLVMHIHDNEQDIEKGILVFLPTYHDLEKQWYLLNPFCSSFKVHILHGSVDPEQALLAMKIWKTHRKVILATNIAESSVTIPKVAYVIDSCRSLQVFWDGVKKKDSVELVWVSKSQADQRKGRTGRTCDGEIYRLVTRSFFNKLQEYESPAILRLSLRQQVLSVCCAESKAINDPRALLQKTLDPPDPQVIEDAFNLLVQIKALDRTSTRGRYIPTFYGRLLASFPLSFDAAVVVLKFGDVGLLREGILMGILMDIQPQPILHPFGDDHLFAEYTFHYFGGGCNDMVKIGTKEKILLGNLGAYKFWQRVFKDKHRLERLKCLSEFDEIRTVTTLLVKIEEEWCSLHNLVQSSLQQVAEQYEDILSSLHLYRPKFLGKCGGPDGQLIYYDPYEFGHVCVLRTQQNGDTTVAGDEEDHEPSSEVIKCCAVPFVDSGNIQNVDVAQKLLAIVKEIRVQLTDDGAGKDACNANDDASWDNAGYVNGNTSHYVDETPLCVYFINGSCSRGSRCSFSHSLLAKKPACKYFFTLQGCRNGDSCPFSHDDSSPIPSFSTSSCVPEDDNVNAVAFLNLLPKSSDAFILFLDDNDLRFSSNFARFFDPTKIIATTAMSKTFLNDSSLKGVRILWDLHQPYREIISKDGTDLFPWSEIKCILWFPNLDTHSEYVEGQKALIQSFFEYLAIRVVADCLYELRIIVTMNNIRFSQLQVEKLGRDSFFFLKESLPFDEVSFGELSDGFTTRKPMVTSKPISYVFELQPPTNVEFDEYASLIRLSMHGIKG